MLQQKKAQKVPEGIVRVAYTAREKWVTPPVWRRESKQLASSARLLCARRTAWQPTKTHSLSLKTLPCAHTCWFYFSRMKSQAQKQGALRKVGSLFSLPEANPSKLLRQTFSWRKKQVEEAAPIGASKGQNQESSSACKQCQQPHHKVGVGCGFSSNIRN